MAYLDWLRTVAQRRRRFVLGMAGIASFLGIWQLFFSIGALNPLLVGEPVGIARELINLLFIDRDLLPHVRVTAVEFSLGFGIGSSLAVLLGLMLGHFRWLDELTEPLIGAFYATPYVAFLPVIILLFGISLQSKVAIVVWAVFFPMLINTIAGVKNTPAEYLRLATSFSVSRARMFFTIIVPASVPYLLAGLRQSIGRGLVGVIVAEFFLASKGIGFFIQSVSSGFRMNEAFAAIAITSIAGLVLVRLVARLERVVSGPWGYLS